MPKLPFSRIFQLSSCLMGGLLSLKLYLLTSSVLFANTPEGAAGAAKAVAAARQAASAVPSEAVQSVPTGEKAEESSVPAQTSAASAPCTGDMKCIGQEEKPDADVDQHVDAARQALLQDLAGRTKQLDEESRKLEELKRAIEASQSVLDERMKKYSEAQSNVAQEEKRKKQLSDEDVDRLVKIYEAMAPREAASIFNVLDFKVMVPVMIKMNPRKTSAILAGMLPERAMMATQLLAGMPRKSTVTRAGTNG
ncbi:MotE family protein [Acetobacter sp.]|uniref:MotE family protein n=1 Tax=Acetobacter sp. TaxID=440 RepID=UPI0039E9B6D5